MRDRQEKDIPLCFHFHVICKTVASLQWGMWLHLQKLWALLYYKCTHIYSHSLRDWGFNGDIMVWHTMMQRNQEALCIGHKSDLPNKDYVFWKKKKIARLQRAVGKMQVNCYKIPFLFIKNTKRPYITKVHSFQSKTIAHKRRKVSWLSISSLSLYELLFQCYLGWSKQA